MNEYPQAKSKKLSLCSLESEITCCLYNFNLYQARKQLIDSESLLGVAMEVGCVNALFTHVISQLCANELTSAMDT